jgi:hypothetical protein
MMGETLLVGTALHAEMKDGLLLPDNDYSTKKLVDHLKSSSGFILVILPHLPV